MGALCQQPFGLGRQPSGCCVRLLVLGTTKAFVAFLTSLGWRPSAAPTHDLDALLVPAPLLLAYDPACTLCCRMALWLARRDSLGLLLILDVRDPNLLALAPELGGKPVEKEIHGLDLGTREIFAGADLLRPIADRLPGWQGLSPVLGIPGFPRLVNRIYLRWAAWRFRRTGRQPFA